MNVGLIDYGRGNLRSVEKALERVGARVQRFQNGNFDGAEALVLPGVGAFGDAMRNLEERGLIEPIKKWLREGRPFLGICLGYQLLFERSEESPNVAGLGHLPGAVVRFPSTVGKVPHMGWNEVQWHNERLRAELPNPSFFYHVHSYYPPLVAPEWKVCETEYNGVRFVSGIGKGKIWAFQFHPEKSQENGRKLLAFFMKQL
ncbi:MAG: imidazole glycerol phosphate synthase subunit HisH [bacterium]